MNAAEKATEAFAYIQKHIPEVYEKYLEFTKSMSEKGGLSPRDKELILVGCSVMSQCEMCIAIHVEGAAAAGATREEILQAALMAVAMGGSPKLMYLKYVFEALEDLFE
ncbi:alkylhydroperoxidase AhpD family core domain-containing protein [Desulfacinum infernum DSM 9756]|jgi:AhpD family alkylhydroperoxidase|uniref:Alkylhydroperoxidase AhpD family core domain-containing protein n=1 Tax=Desulfacinum infernum DSM 9756 TaxID=1121391 RepID=A0A1M4THD5_9BACT|nr:carboxymuconolactone decarboxylase family protein [Desulfacinum infernum]MBC7359057.1 carboxymuconolactone decarboxylase family protein [Desulfacinum sp.]MBZ4658488.1 putative DNA-binding protein [Desulfacinum sp.]SHE43893.1 alkylhydroperoxidase AhpD family core domain-containing protein [Desulfacinum infernum DSM 9756]